MNFFGKKNEKKIEKREWYYFNNFTKRDEKLEGNSNFLLSLINAKESKTSFSLESLTNLSNDEINAQNSSGISPLHYICINFEDIPNVLELLQIMLDREIDVNLVDNMGITPLSYVCIAKRSDIQLEVIRKLIKYEKTDVNKGGYYSIDDVVKKSKYYWNNIGSFRTNSPIFSIIEHSAGNIAAFGMLIGCKRTNINGFWIDQICRDVDVLTLLMYICTTQCYNIDIAVQYLKILLKRADLDLNYTLRNTSSYDSDYVPWWRVWNALRLAIKEPSDNSEGKDSYKIVKILIDDPRCDINKTYGTGNVTILQIAIRRRNIDIVKILLENNKISLNHIPENNSNSALSFAIQEKYYEAVQVLATNKKINMNINIPKLHGNTAFHIACEMEDFELIKILIDAGCDPNIQNDDGNTGLHIVSIKNNHHMIEYLLEKGCDIKIKNKYQYTPFMSCLVNCPLYSNSSDDSDSDDSSDSESSKKTKKERKKRCMKSMKTFLYSKRSQIDDSEFISALNLSCEHKKNLLRDEMLNRLFLASLKNKESPKN
jgi:ankyrin repeat protein